MSFRETSKVSLSNSMDGDKREWSFRSEVFIWGVEPIEILRQARKRLEEALVEVHERLAEEKAREAGVIEVGSDGRVASHRQVAPLVGSDLRRALEHAGREHSLWRRIIRLIGL